MSAAVLAAAESFPGGSVCQATSRGCPALVPGSSEPRHTQRLPQRCWKCLILKQPDPNTELKLAQGYISEPFPDNAGTGEIWDLGWDSKGCLMPLVCINTFSSRPKNWTELNIFGALDASAWQFFIYSNAQEAIPQSCPSQYPHSSPSPGRWFPQTTRAPSRGPAAAQPSVPPPNGYGLMAEPAVTPEG